MSGELLAALIGLALSQFGLWMRIEHRITVLEERLRLREELVDSSIEIRRRRAV